MKVIFQINGKSKEVDTSTIKSASDVRDILKEVAVGKTEDVTQVLENCAKAGQLMKDTDHLREKERKEAEEKSAHFVKLYEEFVPSYQNYCDFRKKNIITKDTPYDKLPEEVLFLLNLHEKNLALKWHTIKTNKAHTYLLSLYPSLKPFCRLLEQIYKQIKKDLKG